MEILLYAPEFAAVPVSAMVLLAVSAILSAIPKSRGLLDLLSLMMTGCAVALSFMMDCDKMLLAALILGQISVYLAFYIQRRNKR